MLSSCRTPLVALACLGLACGGQERPTAGSESHFLRPCTRDLECGSALSCVANLCTQPCMLDAECGEFAEESACLAALEGTSGDLPRVCDVACASDRECAFLGASSRCQDQRCRSGGALATGQSGAGGPAGAGGGDTAGSAGPTSDRGTAGDAGSPFDAAPASGDAAAEDAGPEPSAGTAEADAPGVVGARRYPGFAPRDANASVELDLSRSSYEAAASEDGTIYALAWDDSGPKLVRYDRDFAPLGETPINDPPGFGGPFELITIDSEQHPVVAATYALQNAEPRVLHLLRFTPDGELLWHRAWSRSNNDNIYDLFATRDGRLLVAAESLPEASFDQQDAIVFEFDLGGTLVGETRYGGPEWFDRETRVHAAADGRQVVAWGESGGSAFTAAAYWAWRDPSNDSPTVLPISDLPYLIGVHVGDAHDVFIVSVSAINHYGADGSFREQLDPAAGGEIRRVRHLPDGGFMVNGAARVGDPSQPDAATLFAARFAADGTMVWRMSYDSVDPTATQPAPMIVLPDGTLYAWEYGASVIQRFDPPR